MTARQELILLDLKDRIQSMEERIATLLLSINYGGETTQNLRSARSKLKTIARIQGKPSQIRHE